MFPGYKADTQLRVQLYLDTRAALIIVNNVQGQLTVAGCTTVAVNLVQLTS